MSTTGPTKELPASPPHLLVFKVNDLQKDGHIYKEISERIMAAVPTALQLSQNVFLIQTNLGVKAAEDAAVSLSSTVGHHFNLQVIAPVFAHCDVETGKRLGSLGLDPYCTTPE